MTFVGLDGASAHHVDQVVDSYLRMRDRLTVRIVPIFLNAPPRSAPVWVNYSLGPTGYALLHSFVLTATGVI
jgi:hypothetical protein